LSYDQTQEHAQFICQKEHPPVEHVAEQLPAQDFQFCFSAQAAVAAVV